VIQIRSLEGTAHEKSLAEQIDPQERETKGMPVIGGSVTFGLSEDAVAQGIEDSHSLLDSNPACDFKNSWNCGAT